MPQQQLILSGRVLEALLAQLWVVQGNQLMLVTDSSHAVQLECAPLVALRVSSLHSSAAFIKANQGFVGAMEHSLATHERSHERREEYRQLMHQTLQRLVQEDLSDAEQRTISQNHERDLRARKRTNQGDLRAMKEKNQRLVETNRRAVWKHHHDIARVLNMVVVSFAHGSLEEVCGASFSLHAFCLVCFGTQCGGA